MQAVRVPEFVDLPAESSEESVQVKLRQTDSKLLRTIDASLYPIERGTFGLCEVCTQSIPARRLNAVPWAAKDRPNYPPSSTKSSFLLP